MNSVREAARQRGQSFKDQLIERLDWLSLEDAAAELNCALIELKAQIESGDVIAVEYHQRVLVPAMQLSGGKSVPHLSEVLRAMEIESPWLRLSWLINPNERLAGETPMALLERDPEAVLSAARGVGVQGGA
ncbi:MAG: hypothetical protein U5L08_07385 [Xanthomonadales bacterium]|nr:hypothetical protein [Xanthomonadales bacterium]